MADIPTELKQFLQSGRKLEFDPEESEIGSIELTPFEKLKLTRFRLTLGPQGDIDDPYGSVFKGFYICEAYDLVGLAQRYDASGLLCWIPLLRRFGCINEEHGSIQSFSKATWNDIVFRPDYYLDMQWTGSEVDGEFEEHFPWMILPLHASKPRRVKLSPYGLQSECPVHSTSIQALAGRLDPLLLNLRSHQYKSWWPLFNKKFPRSGLPNTESTLVACQDCHREEQEWFETVKASMLSLTANLIEKTLFGCPNCDFRFRKSEFKKRNPFCRSCGQKLTLEHS